MASSYAAVLSVMQTMHHIKIHPRPPISLDQSQVDSLTQNLTFFQHFLESYPTYEDDSLESRIAAAVYAAEDVIESYIVDQIHDLSKISIVDLCQCLREVMDSIKNEVMKIMGAQIVDQPHSSYCAKIRALNLHQDLEGVIQDMDLIKKEVIQIMIKEKNTDLHTNSSVSPASTWQSSTTPMFDDAMLNEVLDKLTGQQSGLQIIPIVGMGGIGKTTFATSLYTNPLIVQRFDTLAWVTISQEYTRRNILQVLYQEIKGNIDGLSEIGEDEMGEILYRHLWGRRYLIVMDDIWSVEAFYKVKSFFPDNINGSRIMIITRLSNLAFELSGCYIFRMQFLDEDKSWDLLCEIVFGKLDCPIELENIGNEIARKCRGLPLSIAVIGGLLRKSNMKKAYWIYTLENLNLLINLDDHEYTLRILGTSYKELSMHLKPCFLYMGIFPEDYEIKTSALIKLWVAEGILTPNDNKSLEEVAKGYVKELVDRNLMLIPKYRWDGETKLCKIHDLLRDLCLREAHKQKFFCTLRQQKHHTPQGINMERRICINPENKTTAYSPQFLQAVESASHTRSLLYIMRADDPDRKEASPSLRFRLLRVYSQVDNNDSIFTYSSNAIFKQANLRYLSVKFNCQHVISRLLSSCSRFWNLQTLVVRNGDWNSSKPIIASKIWEMPLIRHVMLKEFVLLDPPSGEHNYVLENLHTLSLVRNFKFSEEVVKRIPSIRKLKLIYGRDGLDVENELPEFCLNNLGRLQKLESLNLQVANCEYRARERIAKSFVFFPHSLKKLTLDGTWLTWEYLTRSIGSLPLLQFLKLYGNACVGPKWETIEGQFCNLSVLEILHSKYLKYWETDSAHFPRLERLRLIYLHNLEEIPSTIGDIPTLKSIQVVGFNKAIVESAKRIKEEQEENGNEDLQVVYS